MDVTERYRAERAVYEREERFRASADRFLAKPFTPRELVEKVAELIEG